MSSTARPFIPAFGGNTIVPGCSDKTPRCMYLAEQQGRQGLAVKLTTASRASAALEQYWQQHASACTGDKGNSNASTSTSKSAPSAGQHSGREHLPGGERELAHRTRDACWRDSVHLEHQPGHFLPDCQGTPRDIEEKEKGRTRGIPGYTGCQPPPGASRPPVLPPPVEVSRWTAINAFDERRPRIKGIPGYTGHQPHPDAATAAAHPAAAAPSKPQVSTVQHATHNAPQHSHPAPQAPLRTPEPQLAHTTTAANTFGRLGNSSGSSSSSGHSSQQQQYSSYAAGSASITGYPAAATATEFGASAGSRISSPPRYFCDGVEVPSGQVPAPPGSAAPTDTVLKCGSYSSMGVPQPNSNSNSNSNSSGCMPNASHGVIRSGHQAAEVLLLNQSMGQSGGTGPAVGLSGEHGNAALLLSNRSGQGEAGSHGATFGVGGVGGVRVGSPAIGPWSSTYSSTFVQQEAYHSLMQQFKEAALQRQQQQQHRQ